MLIRYSRWDGSQNVPDLDADDLLSQMSDDLLSDGDPWRALRRLMQQGFQPPDGRRMTGLKDLLEQLKRRRQQQLERYKDRKSTRLNSSHLGISYAVFG